MTKRSKSVCKHSKSSKNQYCGSVCIHWYKEKTGLGYLKTQLLRESKIYQVLVMACNNSSQDIDKFDPKLNSKFDGLKLSEDTVPIKSWYCMLDT